MLDLTGRKGDGWLPSVPYLEPGGLAAGTAAIDEAAARADRDPREIRRLLNVPGAAPAQLVEELTRYALEDGIGTFFLMADDARTIQTFAEEIAPAVRERAAAARGGTAAPSPVVAGSSEYERLGVAPTPDDRQRSGAAALDGRRARTGLRPAPG